MQEIAARRDRRRLGLSEDTYRLDRRERWVKVRTVASKAEISLIDLFIRRNDSSDERRFRISDQTLPAKIIFYLRICPYTFDA
jgi:hypothetical protein